MANPKTTLGLGSKTLAAFLKLVSQAEDGESGPVSDQDKAELLGHMLGHRLAVDRPATRGSTHGGEGPAGEPLQAMLLARQTPIPALERIKQYGVEKSESALSEVDRQVATVVYYAAIASALRFHSVKLTGYTYKELGGSFSTLAKGAWMTPNLKEHFEEAAKVCETKACEGEKDAGTNG